MPGSQPAALWRRITGSLQGKLILLLSTTLIVISTVLLAIVIGVQYQRVAQLHADAARQLNGLLQATLENAMLKRDIPGLEQIVARLGQQQDIDRVMILNPAGVVRFSSDPAMIGAVLNDAQITQAETRDTGASAQLTKGSQSTVMRSVNAVRNRDECKTCHGSPATNPINGLLVVDHATGSLVAQALRNAAGLIVLGGLATAAASVALFIGLRRIVVTPVAALVDANRNLADGDLTTRLPASENDEIGKLSSSFNEMAENLQAGHDALERAHQFSQALIDAIPDGLRVIGPDFIIRRANTAYARQIGQPLDRIVGQPCYMSSHGRDTPCPHTLVTCPVVEIKSAARDTRLTFRDRHRNGNDQQVEVEVSSARLHSPLAQGCVVEAIRDLDEAARISHQQRLSEIGLLATGVAHEINNPLNSMQFALEALKRDISARNDQRAGDYLDIMRQEIARCIDITGGLLKLSAPSGSARGLLDLGQIAQEVVTLLGYEAERSGVSIEMDIADKLRVQIGDSDLRILLSNLALNALHAMPDGGVLRIAARRQDDRIALVVADTGVGIPPADLPHIFLPFWSRRANNTAGRGLGLSIVRAIVDQLGADISVDSTPGQGTSFTVRLPDPDSEHSDDGDRDA